MMKKYLLICTIVIGLFTLNGCQAKAEGSNFSEESFLGKESLPIENFNSCFVFDIYDPRAEAGFYENIFIGKIQEVTGTTYIYATNVEPEDYEDEEDCLPYTNYNVTVLESLKGELPAGSTQPVRKKGGLMKDESFVWQREGDVFPVPGDICVIGSNLWGEVQLSSVNRSKDLIDFVSPNARLAVSADIYQESELYDTYVNAVNDPIPFEE